MLEYNKLSVESIGHHNPIVYNVLVLSDLHEPYSDVNALRLAVEAGVAAKVDAVIILGDGVDFYKVSFWGSDPERMSLRDEIYLARARFAEIAELFPSADKFYVAGNHEHRLKRFIWSKAPELSGIEGLDVPALLGLNELGFRYIDNIERVMQGKPFFSIGKLYYIHGHEIRASFGAVNVSRVMYQKAASNLIAGHYHVSQQYMQHKLDHTHDGCWSVGCLCHTVAEYAPHSAWNQGFALVRYYENGLFSVSNKMIINGEVV